MHNKMLKVVVLAAVLSPLVLAETGPQGAIPLEDNGSPRLEIRNYRFQAYRHQGYERLVLEFTRKDTNLGTQPTVKVTPTGSGEVEIGIDRAVLMGAIPESLINDSYQAKSRYLGTLSVNADNPGAGFSLRTSLKNPNAHLKAFWLTKPTRLVIDARVGKGFAANEESSSPRPEKFTVSRKRPAQPSFDKYICFPAAASVGMNVIFQTQIKKEEELKNVHVNLQGTSVQEVTPPPPDSIVCYPRVAQVVAQLGFEMPTVAREEQGDVPAANRPAEGGAPAPAQSNSRPAAAPAPVAGAAMLDDSDMTLNPEPQGVRMPGSTVPKPAPILPPPPTAATPAPAAVETPKRAAVSSPASLLPPLK